MKLSDLLKELNEARTIVGDADVQVTGLYGSSADEIKVVTDLTNGTVILETDICSG